MRRKLAIVCLTGGFGTFGNLQTAAAAPAPARSGLLVARFQF